MCSMLGDRPACCNNKQYELATCDIALQLLTFIVSTGVDMSVLSCSMWLLWKLHVENMTAVSNMRLSESNSLMSEASKDIKQQICKSPTIANQNIIFFLHESHTPMLTLLTL